MDKIIIATSTHWDREWYRTFQEFQIRLCDLINRLLELLEREDALGCYTFDGQCVVLEDYLEIFPENRERIERLVREGRLIFGPLYNLPDEFLSGGEALIRNFLMGEEVTKGIGKKLNVGYVPDNFGHISQLPQILNGVGIKNAFFFRGTNMDTVKYKEFYWEGPDKSRVLAEYMPLGYWSLKSWGKLGKSVVEHFREAYEQLKEHSALNVFLMINGSDHLYQDPEFGNMLGEVQRAFPELSIRNGSFEDYARLAEKAAEEKGEDLVTIHGELRDFRYGPDPTAVTSTRMELKKRLFDTLAEAERYAEPLNVIASELGNGYTYPAGFFRKAWKKILVSLGHDGITGCSTDETMRDIGNYLTHAGEILSTLRDAAFRELLAEDENGEEQFVLFNPNPWPYTGVVRQVLHIEEGETTWKDFTLEDAEGTEVPYEIQRVYRDVITREFPYNSKERVYRTCFEILFRAEHVSALGRKAYRIVKKELREKRKEEFFVRSQNSQPELENEFCRVTVNPDASVNVYDKKSGKWYRNLNQLIARGDAGDEYQHVSPVLDRHVFPVLQGISLIRNSSLSESLELSVELSIPESRDVFGLGEEQGSGRLKASIRVTLYAGEDRVEFETRIENQCRDFILYAKFPAPFEGAKDYSYVSFDEVIRDQNIYGFDPELKSTQSFLKPMQRYGGVIGSKDRMDLLTKGLYEYHVKPDQQGMDFYLTLLRSTSYMFHGLPLSWLDGQHSTTPIVETKGSRGLGESECRYALILNGTNTARAAEEYCYPPVGLEGRGTKLHKEEENSFLELASEHVRISALKKSEDGDGVIVRLYQTEEEEIRTELFTQLPIESCAATDLLERTIQELPHEEHRIPITIKSKQIVTLKIKWRRI